VTKAQNRTDFIIFIGISGISKTPCHPVKFFNIKYENNRGFKLIADNHDIWIRTLHDLIDYYVSGGSGAKQLKIVYSMTKNQDLINQKGVNIDKTSLDLRKPIYNTNVGEQESWFHSNIFGHEASKILGKNSVETGSFLVRYSFSKPDCYTLSVKTQNSIKNIGIVKSRNNMYHLKGKTDPQFTDLKSLIDYLGSSSVKDNNGETIEICFKKMLKNVRNTSILKASDIDSHFKRINELEFIENEESDYFANDKISFLESEWKKLEPEYYDPKNIQSRNSVDPSGRKFRTTFAAADAQNLSKNRYHNILPYDHSRVVLKYGRKYPYLNNMNNQNVSDEYVNANIIGRYGSQERGRSYIACQGPLDGAKNKANTICDFWRTVVVSKVKIIIMATQLKEKNQVGVDVPKCAQYWPNEKNVKKYSQDGKEIIEVENIEEKDHEVYKKRKFFLKPLMIDQIGDQDLLDGWEVVQYHFKKWPDHGVLDDPYYIIDFLTKIHEEYEGLPKGSKGDKIGSTGNKAGPLLVHCSAGVGRTGTFIAIDMLMDRLRWFGVESEIDIFGAVEHMRNYRMCTVQSAGQYEFIYKAMKCYVQSLLVDSYEEDNDDDDGAGKGLMQFDQILGRKNRYTIRKK